MEEAALDEEAVTDPGAGAAQGAGEGDLDSPGVVLGLQVGQRGERAQGQEARLEIADGALDPTLRGGSPWRQRHGLRAQLSEQGQHLEVEPGPLSGALGHDRGVVVVHDRLGHAAQALEAAHECHA
jgi:hypothetical protein